jgi:PIN domain nuclease of toxin-antitoxin system
VSGHFLADTNVVIWTISRSDRLSSRVKRTLADATASIAVSVASVWEIVVKHQAGKLVFDMSLDLAIDQILYRSSWTIAPITSEHLPVLANLPMLHKDPFDRILIAQAQHQNLTILTPDDKIRNYDVATLW